MPSSKPLPTTGNLFEGLDSRPSRPARRAGKKNPAARHDKPSEQAHPEQTPPDKAPPDQAPEPAIERSVVRVAVAVPVRKLFDYSVPEAMRDDIAPGFRVRVPFHGRAMVGYVVEVASAPSSGQSRSRLKAIRGSIGDAPTVSPSLLQLAQWMSDRTLASVGECLEAMVPGGVRLQKRGRRERTVQLARDPDEVAAALDELEARAPRRGLILRLLLQHEGAGTTTEPLPARDLLARAHASSSPLQTLARDGWVKIDFREIEPALAVEAIAAEDSFVPERLTFEQVAAERRVAAAIDRGHGGAFLLHGVTGSGKTEVYLRAIAKVISDGQGAIVLVPEIALTPQLVQRFRSRFSRVAVLHSSLSDPERSRAWRRIRDGEVDVVIGPRSALFAPFSRLGLIVLDEEHETTYKQESTPRYHARDTALERGRIDNAVVILGSATPSLVSWFAAGRGSVAQPHPEALATSSTPADRGSTNRKAESQSARARAPTRLMVLSLPERVSGRPMPRVTLIDMRQEFHEQKRRAILSRTLEQRTEESLARGEQVILFMNRRGFSTFVHCIRCGWTQKCRRCAIHMTYHRRLDRAWCHYCGETAQAPQDCPECSEPGVRYWGFGTERIADEISERFPDARMLRMDSDTMTTRGAYEQSFGQLRRGEIDILLGTQMIAKGLDLPNVTLVGVLHADIALAFPDYRAAERTFQLVSQVAGRTGRGEKGGEVIVQCFNPEHYAIACARDHDYERFAAEELAFRKGAGYPPFTRLIRVLVEGEDPGETEGASRELRARLASLEAEGASCTRGWSILGPVIAPIPKIKDRHRWHMLIKLADSAALDELGQAHGDLLLAPPRGAGRKRPAVHVTVDVDPVAML